MTSERVDEGEEGKPPPGGVAEPTHTQPWQGSEGQWHFSDGSYMNPTEVQR